jgi:hypothetical protein
VINANSAEAYLRDYDFEKDAAKAVVASSWMAYYNVIVDLNSLLATIDERRDLFSNGNYELIKGEAKGLRAFLHFDALRLWGPVPLGADTSRVAIPYVKEVMRDLGKLQSVSYGRVLREIIADLDEAEELLAADPVKTASTPYDDFQIDRQYRFNYYAVKATKARYYQWINQPVLAANNAREVIEAVYGSGTTKIFTLATEHTVGGTKDVDPDLTMSVEHIFALHIPRFSPITEPFFYMGDCKQDITAIAQAYETGFHSNDIRCKVNRYWEELQSPKKQAVFKKFYDPSARVSATVMPLIRLAEMYFIVMECSTLEEANERLTEFRVARVMEISIENSLLTSSDVYSRLEREYRKDFYGEGQMFYFYKRHATPTLTWPTLVENIVYQVPKPEQQTNFELEQNK